MMKKNFLKLGVVAMVLAMFASCSQNDDMFEGLDNVSDDNTKKEYVYTVHVDGDVPGFFEDGTRAVGSWQKGDVLQLNFKNGSNYVTGSATYDGSVWTMISETNLSATSATECEALYIQNGQYSSTLTPSSVVYYGIGTYHTSSVDMYVKVTVVPITWRMRFKGNSGARISMPGSENDITYITRVGKNTSSGKFGLNTAAQDVQLTVGSNGYTEYIHGVFSNLNGNNTLTVINESEGKTYTKEFSASKLQMGESGYLTIPTSSNYTSLGWEQAQSETIDPNAVATCDYLCTLYDGMVMSWSFGSTAKTFYTTVFKSLSDYESDEEIIAEILDGNTVKNVADYDGYSTGYWGEWYSSSTSYYLCTIAYNAKGERGPLQKIPFTTRSYSEPIAAVSNFKAATSGGVAKWTFDVSLTNGATKYHISSSEYADDYNSDERWMIYYSYYYLSEDTPTYDYEAVSFNRDDTQCVLVTIARDKNNKIGGYSVAKGNTSSYVREKREINQPIMAGNTNKECHSMRDPQKKSSAMFFKNAN